MHVWTRRDDGLVLRLETKGPAHDRAGDLVPRTGFEPVLPG